MTSAAGIGPDLAGEIDDAHAAPSQFALERVASGQNFLNREKVASTDEFIALFYDVP
jgi:hypothetical protein